MFDDIHLPPPRFRDYRYVLILLLKNYRVSILRMYRSERANIFLHDNTAHYNYAPKNYQMKTVYGLLCAFMLCFFTVALQTNGGSSYLK